MSILPQSCLLSLVTLLVLSACGTAPAPCRSPLGPDHIYVVSQDWHSEIAIPIDELSAELRTIGDQFPGAQALLFGYGRQSFMTAANGSFEKYLTGPFPGDAAIQVTALDASPLKTYPADEIVALALPSDGAARLSAFIRSDIQDNPDGTARTIEHSHDPESFVYAANSRYNFLHTCNGWIADALADAGVSLSPSRVVTSDRLMQRVKLAAETCEAPPVAQR